MPESPRLAYPPSCKHLWKVSQLEGWRRFETDTHAGLLMQETPRSHSDSHTCSIFAYASPRLRLSHVELLPFSAPLFGCTEPQGRAQQHICCSENKATKTQCHQEILQHYWKVSGKRVFFFFANTKTTLVLSAATTSTCEQGISILCSHRINTRFRRHCPHAVNRYFMSMLLNARHLHRPLHYIAPLVEVYPNFWVKTIFF